MFANLDGGVGAAVGDIPGVEVVKFLGDLDGFSSFSEGEGALFHDHDGEEDFGGGGGGLRCIRVCVGELAVDGDGDFF